MMKILKLSFLCILLTLLSCSTNKRLYESKEYDKIITKLSDKAYSNNINESEFEFLKNSYHQANQEDFQKIMELKKTGQPDIWLDVFYKTRNISSRQKKVDRLSTEIKKAMNYKKLSLDEEMTMAKTKAEAYLVAKTNVLLNEKNYNEAEIFINNLYKLNSHNANIEELWQRCVMSNAQHILFRIATPVDLEMPDDFAQLALDFDENIIYDVPFDIVPRDSIEYDLMIRVMIDEKNISPERVDAVTFEERNGDKVAKIIDKTMSKSATIVGEIELIDVKEKAVLMKTPFDISSTFRYKYASFDGDKGACSEQTLSLLSNEVVDFPSDSALLRDVARKLNEVIKTRYQKK